MNVYIETYGCQMNVNDSEVVLAILQKAGYERCHEMDRADLTLEIDVQNPSADPFTVETLEAILYRGIETSPFATLVLQESKSIEPKSEATVPLPLKARFTRPLALLGGGLSTDLSAYTADLDLTVRKGSFKKRITQERVPLDQLGSLLGKTAKTKGYEKE